MSQTAIKPLAQASPLNKDVVIQITKAQLIKFFQVAVIIGMVVLNILAIKIASPFLKELFVSQAILVLIFFIKHAKVNHISK
jgi:quinol-cytochrome oxidoreductase complex cytochrome b subunit|tara:strand:+ start:79 stop:324 length:246 start_codon:yes stop_codon:yes gene_type:complete